MRDGTARTARNSEAVVVLPSVFRGSPESFAGTDDRLIFQILPRLLNREVAVLHAAPDFEHAHRRLGLAEDLKHALARGCQRTGHGSRYSNRPGVELHLVYERPAECSGVDRIAVGDEVGLTANGRSFDEPFRSPDLRVDQIVDVCVVQALWLATHPSAISRVAAVLVRPLSATAQEWLVDKAQRFGEGLGALRSRSMVLGVIGVTLVTRAVGLLTIQCWLWAFGLSLPIYAPLVILLFISVGVAIPSSPGFIGTFHIACAYALELMGVVPEVAASVAIAGHFMATVPWTVAGLFVSFPGIRRVWQQQRESLRPVEHVAST